MVQSIALITQEVCGQEGGRVGHKVLLCFVLEVSDLISAWELVFPVWLEVGVSSCAVV